MKKSTKSAKPAAPQVKSAAPKPVAPKPAPKTTARKKVAPKPVSAVPPGPTLTTITARIDIGFGNTLFLRGEGPGLSWDRGVALECLDDDKWSVTLSGATRPVIFKFLVNDLTWSAGSDYVVEPGSSTALKPSF